MAAGKWAQSGNVRLYVESSAPKGAEQGHVLIVHGAGEHLGRHQFEADALVANGYAVTRLDLRGFGRSGGLRGHVDHFADYLEDLKQALALQERSCTFLLGQSLGGLVAVLFALKYSAMAQGVILCSPCLALQMRPPSWKKTLAKTIGTIVPRMRVKSGLPLEGLSHDPQVAAAYRADPLCYDKVSARWYNELNKAMAKAQADARLLACPVLILAGGADPIVSTAATQEFFAQVGAADKRIIVYPEAYHELFNEECRDEAISEVLDWLHAIAKR